MTIEAEARSDRTLMDCYLHGHEDAAVELYQRYARRLMGLVNKRCPRQLGSSADTDDLVQSVFRRFFQGARAGQFQIPEGDDLWGLLLVIALNRLRSERKFCRAAKRDARKTIDLGSLTPGSEPEAPDSNARLPFFQMELEALLDEMPDHYRKATELRVQGFSVAEIAAELDTSKRSVERILQESRDRLRALIVLDE